ncbi:MAG TPA: bis(5'-nucleosyl)-tetraphosphatase (symmetrical) YqeK [Dehalococcoidia bacterium]
MDAAALRARMGHLPAGLLEHIDRVVAEARRLAPRYGIDPERAALAAQAHDVARALPPAELLRLARELAVPTDEVDRAVPVLLHGPVGARLLERDYGVTDPEVLAAARSHTTGSPEMSPLEKLVFVADKIEPEKLRRRERLGEVRRLAEEGDLDGALLAYLDGQLLEAAARGWLLHPLEVHTRNRLLRERAPLGEPREAEA